MTRLEAAHRFERTREGSATKQQAVVNQSSLLHPYSWNPRLLLYTHFRKQTIADKLAFTLLHLCSVALLSRSLGE